MNKTTTWSLHWRHWIQVVVLLIIFDHFPMIFIHFPTRMTLPRQFWMPQNPLPGCVPFLRVPGLRPRWSGATICSESWGIHHRFFFGGWTWDLFTGHLRNRLIGGTDSIYVWPIFQAYVYVNIPAKFLVKNMVQYGYLHFRILKISHWFIVQLDWWMHLQLDIPTEAQMKRFRLIHAKNHALFIAGPQKAII